MEEIEREEGRVNSEREKEREERYVERMEGIVR